MNLCQVKYQVDRLLNFEQKKGVIPLRYDTFKTTCELQQHKKHILVTPPPALQHNGTYSKLTEPTLAELPLPIAIAALPLFRDLFKTILLFTLESLIDTDPTLATLPLPIAIAALPLFKDLLRIILLLIFEPLTATDPTLAAFPLPMAMAALPLFSDLLRMMLLFTLDSAIALKERTDAIANTATDVKVFMVFTLVF